MIWKNYKKKDDNHKEKIMPKLSKNYANTPQREKTNPSQKPQKAQKQISRKLPKNDGKDLQCERTGTKSLQRIRLMLK